MSYFKGEPVLVLNGMEAVREKISETEWLHSGLDSFAVKSDWLIDLIDEIETSGQYPYNATVKRLAEQRLGMPPQSEAYYAREGDALSRLIYNAQCYRDSDRLTAQGYVPFSNSLIETVGEGGRIQTKDGKILTVKRVGEKLYAFLPRKRVYAARPEGQPVKVIATANG